MHDDGNDSMATQDAGETVQFRVLRFWFLVDSFDDDRLMDPPKNMAKSESEPEEDIAMNPHSPDIFTSESEFDGSPADEPDQENDLSSDDNNDDSDVYEGSTSEERWMGHQHKRLKKKTLHTT